MWNHQHQYWYSYPPDKLAISDREGRFLSRFLKDCLLNRRHLASMEILDLQVYRQTRHPGKIQSFLMERNKGPFRFPIYLN